MKNKGFVLLEAIIVITVLCVILISLYASYSKLLVKVNKKSLYDNTEYLYKANIVRKYLEQQLDENIYSDKTIYIYCSNTLQNQNACYDESSSSEETLVFKELGVESVYISLWNTGDISVSDKMYLEATTQNYINNLDPPNEPGYRIIVMFKCENNETEKRIFEYASLRFGSRR